MDGTVSVLQRRLNRSSRWSINGVGAFRRSVKWNLSCPGLMVRVWWIEHFRVNPVCTVIAASLLYGQIHCRWSELVTLRWPETCINFSFFFKYDSRTLFGRVDETWESINLVDTGFCLLIDMNLSLTENRCGVAIVMTWFLLMLRIW